MENEIEAFIQYTNIEKKRSRNTCVSYKRDLQKFMLFCQNQQIYEMEKINLALVQRYIIFLEKEKLSSASVSRHMSALKTFFSYEIKQGNMQSNPMELMKKPKVERKMPVVLNEFQVDALLKMPNVHTLKGCRDKAMLELLYATGIRVSEMLELKTENINTELSYITCGHAGKQRVVPFGKHATQALQSYLDQVRKMLAKDKCDFLFVSLKGEKMSRQGFWKIIKHYAKQAGIEEEITPNTIRHSFAFHLVQNGADLHIVQEMLGYADMNSTQVYAEMSKKKIREVYNKTHPRF